MRVIVKDLIVLRKDGNPKVVDGKKPDNGSDSPHNEVETIDKTIRPASLGNLPVFFHFRKDRDR